MPEPIDIKTAPLEVLWRVAFEQQQLVTNALAQMQQAQANIAAIQAEISARVGPPETPAQ